MTKLLAMNRIVWPSGGALATYPLPMTVPAPGFVSTSTGWPQRAASFSETRRASTSAEPPGANGTMKCTGLLGKAWACAASGTRAAQNAAAMQVRIAERMRFGMSVVSEVSCRELQAFFVQALHQPLPATSLPAKSAQGPVASAALPVNSWQLTHFWSGECLGNFLVSARLVSST